MRLILSRQEGQKRQQNYAMELQRIQMERDMRIEKIREEFRTEKPYLAGLYYTSFVPSNKIEFESKKKSREGNAIVDSILTLSYLTGALNEVVITGGYVKNSWMFKGNMGFGSTNAGKSFNIDSTWSTQQNKWIRNTAEVSSISTFRLSCDALYAFYFVDPILAYGGAGLDIGSISVKTKEDYYDGRMLAGSGLSAGIMLHFSPVLIDVNYKFNIVGTSAGSMFSFGVLYKF
jgi:hypothetical protein